MKIQGLFAEILYTYMKIASAAATDDSHEI